MSDIRNVVAGELRRHGRQFICKRLNELTELQSEFFRALITEDILLLLKSAEKLKLLLSVDVTNVCYVLESYKFDATAFEIILKIVDSSFEKSRWEICFDEECYNVNIPYYSVETHKGSVTVNENIIQ